MKDKVRLGSGVRERKRSEVLDRIARASLSLFVEKGFEATTLDEIAEVSGISRRNFFNYFKSKEDVLLAYESSGFAEALPAAILEETSTDDPMEAARNAFQQLASKYETKESVVADQLLRSTEALRLRKDAMFLRLEQTLAESFYSRWPTIERIRLRMTAVIAMGVLRMALDSWRAESGQKPLRHHLEQMFVLFGQHVSTHDL